MADAPQLPNPPDMERRLQFYRTQLWGMPVILLIPILALLGIFNNGTAIIERSNDVLALELEYPDTCRYTNTPTFHAFITNKTPDTISEITVRLDRAYLSNFVDIEFLPNAETITQDAYQITLEDVQPGETRFIHANLRCERYGVHSFKVEAMVGDQDDPVSVTGKTIIFP